MDPTRQRGRLLRPAASLMLAGLMLARPPAPPAAASPAPQAPAPPAQAPPAPAPQTPARAIPTVLGRVTVAAERGRFLAWPANNGLWHWDGGREILVGYGDGPWVEREEGHKVGHPQVARLARSRDGGLTWRTESPDPFVDREGPAQPLAEPIRLDDPNLAIRVAGGSPDPDGDRLGRFLVSTDRGRNWRGPFRFEGLEREPELRGLVLTSRTSLRVRGPASAQLLLSARDPRLGRLNKRLDKTFVAETVDGGRSFRFLSWVVPWSDPYRAVMPALVDLGNGRLVVALRRRDPRGTPETPSWIDAYASDDDGRSWRLLSRVGTTGVDNGNPPALARLPDGRLAVAYANRNHRAMVLRLSDDDGQRWGPPLQLRTGALSWDLGYPQMTGNQRGELVVIYYLATAERPHSFLEATRIRP